MKLFSAATVLLKMILSIAGIVFLINKLSDSKSQDGYKFDLDSAINKEKVKTKARFTPAKKFDFGDLQKSYYRSMDI